MVLEIERVQTAQYKKADNGSRTRLSSLGS